MDDLIRRGDAVSEVRDFAIDDRSTAELLVAINALPAATPEPPAEPKKLDARAALLFMAEAFDGADERGHATIAGERYYCFCHCLTKMRIVCIIDSATESAVKAVISKALEYGSDYLFPLDTAGARQRAAWCREQAAKLEPVVPATRVRCWVGQGLGVWAMQSEDNGVYIGPGGKVWDRSSFTIAEHVCHEEITLARALALLRDWPEGRERFLAYCRENPPVDPPAPVPPVRPAPAIHQAAEESRIIPERVLADILESLRTANDNAYEKAVEKAATLAGLRQKHG